MKKRFRLFSAIVLSIIIGCATSPEKTPEPVPEPPPAVAPEIVPEPPAPEPPPPRPLNPKDFVSSFILKSGPPACEVSRGGGIVKGKILPDGRRLFKFEIEGDAEIEFSAPGCVPQKIRLDEIRPHLWFAPKAKAGEGELSISLKPSGGPPYFAGAYKTGGGPKSLFFSENLGTAQEPAYRIFVPLLFETFFDVYRFAPNAPPESRCVIEKRLALPDGRKNKGFVEALLDGRRRELWVSNMEDGAVHIFNLDSLEYKQSVKTGGSWTKVIAQSADGSLAAASNWLSMDVSVFDGGTKALLAVIPTGGTPRGLAFSPDGKLLYAAIYDRAEIAVIDIAKKRKTASWTFYPGAGAARHIVYKSGADGDVLYVSDMLRGRIVVLDAATGKVLRWTRVAFNINTIDLSGDGKTLYVSSRGKNGDDYLFPGPDLGAVYLLDADDLSLKGKLWGGNQPTGLDVSPDGKWLGFTNLLDDTMEIYSLE